MIGIGVSSNSIEDLQTLCLSKNETPNLGNIHNTHNNRKIIVPPYNYLSSLLFGLNDTVVQIHIPLEN